MIDKLLTDLLGEPIYFIFRFTICILLGILLCRFSKWINK